MTNKTYARLALALIAVWFVCALSAAALHAFQTGPDGMPMKLGLGALTPLLAFFIWFGVSPKFRAFTLSLNPRSLTVVQAWRTAGFVFVTLYSFSILPGVFALPAGWGDFAIGLTAPWVALRLADPAHRGSFILWQLLGVSDLVLAVSLGTTAQFLNPHGISTAPMTALPLSLIPTFAVPLFFILHVICIAQATRWREVAHVTGTKRAPAMA